MSLGTRPKRPISGGGPPAWLIFLVGIALVFGLYYVWIGVRNYLRSGGLGVVESTRQASIRNTATAERQLELPSSPISVATLTPIPACQEFVVIVPSAIVRERPSTSAAIITAFSEGTRVCVLEHIADSEWYTVDSKPETRRADIAYMREDVIQAVNPTPTPTKTFTPPPTVTLTPTVKPSITPTSQPSATRDPRVSDTPTPTLSPTPTLPLASA